MLPPFPRGLYAIVDLDALGIREPAELAAAVLEGGAVAVQLRAKNAPGGDVLRAARQLLPLCAARGVPLVVNDRVDVALAAGAQGVHVGQRDLEPAEVRRQCAGSSVRILGLSTHDLDQLRAAAREGIADYLGYGPVFSTRSKAGADATVGLAGVQAAVRASDPPAPPIEGFRRGPRPPPIESFRRGPRPPPIVAIGGIGPGTARELATLGAHAVAVIDALARADDPRAVAAAFREAFA